MKPAFVSIYICYYYYYYYCYYHYHGVSLGKKLGNHLEEQEEQQRGTLPNEGMP